VIVVVSCTLLDEFDWLLSVPDDRLLEKRLVAGHESDKVTTRPGDEKRASQD
jgi:hypothetical protein